MGFDRHRAQLGGGRALPALENDSGTVVIAVEHQAAERTPMDPLGEGFWHEFPTATTPLACVLGIHQHHLSPSTLSLVDGEKLELPPARIQNTLVQPSLGRRAVGQV